MFTPRGPASGRLLRQACTLLFALFAAVPPASAASQAGVATQSNAVTYRIFLRDGGTIVSYGEFAHVADRVVISIPIGGTDSSPLLHLLTIAEADVDWERTNAYVQAARARRYAETRGEEDFARLTREVADVLQEAGSTDDSARRLALAEAARRRLIDWPAEHHAYRADDVAQMTSWLDQVVSELRLAAGQSSFALSLVARTPTQMPAVQLLPAPDFRERAEFGLVAAQKTVDPAERVSLLRAVLDTLQPDAPPGSWMAALHARASADLASELKTDQAYAALTTKTLARADTLAGRANVRALEALVRTVLDEDARLQRSRPSSVTGLLAALDARLDSARRLRLAIDAWELRTALLKTYWSEVRQALDRFLGLRNWLTDVRQLAGPSAGALRRVAYESQYSGHELSKVKPPAEIANAHATLVSACALAARAASMRLDALRSGSMDDAWQASSAAAGALMLLDQAVLELRRVTREPKPGTR